MTHAGIVMQNTVAPKDGNSVSTMNNYFVSDVEALEILESLKVSCRPELSRYGYRFVKRTFDLLLSGLALVVLFIPSLVLCTLIYFKSPGAGSLYCQRRVKRLGKDGSVKTFRMWKFRSMVPHAEDMLESLQKDNEADGPLFKIKEDPRIIPGIGNFIRAHSIDELPQIINVFLGQMSFIGPRPPLPKEVLTYTDHEMKRLSVKPGCSGLWQVSERSDSSFREMVDQDLTYIEKSGIAYDLKLMAKTISAMIAGGGRLLDVLRFRLLRYSRCDIYTAPKAVV